MPIRNRVLYSVITILILLLVAAGYYLARGGKINNPLTTSSSNPVGASVVFAAKLADDKSNNGAHLFVLNKDGSYKDLSTDTTTYKDALNPTFSPDMTRIVYTTYLADGMQLVSLGTDGSNKQVLTKLEGQKYGISWSPDGKKILYNLLQMTQTSGVFDQNSVIVQLDLDSDKETILPLSYKTEVNPSWLFDGSGFVYLGSDNDQDFHLVLSKAGKNSEVKINVGGKQITDLVNAQVSPDNKKVLFTRNFDGQIYTTSLNGGDAKRLTDGKGDRFACASWSKDGSYILAQHSQATKSASELAYVNVADGSVKTWTNSSLTNVNCPRAYRY